MSATNAELAGWVIAILMFFIPPLFVLTFVRAKYPDMEAKRSFSFYVGWIPGNLIACGYLGWSTGSFENFISILIFSQAIQLIFVIGMSHLFIHIFGERAFPD